MSDEPNVCPKCGAELLPGCQFAWACGSIGVGVGGGQFGQSKECRIRELENELAMWRPLTPEEAQKAYDEAVAEPMSDEEIKRIVKAAMDPAERVPNSEQMQLAVKVRELEARLKTAESDLAYEAEQHRYWQTQANAVEDRAREMIAELRFDSENYRGKCDTCGTANADMLTDTYCAVCEVRSMQAKLAVERMAVAELRRQTEIGKLVRSC